MIEIGDTLVSFDIFDTFFCCDLEACKGACCIEGESGAPLLDPQEKELVCETYPIIEPLLPEEHKRYIEEKGLMYYDEDDDLVTNIIGGRQCVFTCFECNKSCRCAFEKSYSLGVNKKFYKPISCHLYPIRLKQYDQFIAVNYDRWYPICEPARELGRKLGIRLYQFLKDPLIRAFGESWYEELERAAETYLSEKAEKREKKRRKHREKP